MDTYVLMLSKTFPAYHPRKGEPTDFRLALKNTLDFWRYDLSPVDMLYCKLHTIRANYLLWKKRFEKIERGEACLSIRQWEGKPRRSKTVEIARLDYDYLEKARRELLKELHLEYMPIPLRRIRRCRRRIVFRNVCRKRWHEFIEFTDTFGNHIRKLFFPFLP